jgi:von Willebrand factor type D domain
MTLFDYITPLDPHFRTMDGTLYTFHGECDLVMATSSTFDAGLGLDLHARTKMVTDWSLISNVALRIGDDIFEVENDGTHYLNGIRDVAFPITLAGKYIVTREDSIVEGSEEEHTQLFYTIELDDNRSVLVSNFKTMLGVSVDGEFEGTHGMLGTYQLDGMIGRDGITKYEDANRMGTDWQVNPDVEPMLFHDISGPQFPESCTLPSSNMRRRRLEQHSDEFLRKAKEICSALPKDLFDVCLNDILATDDLDVGRAYAF